MLRIFFLCSILFILLFPAHAQESALPFAYVTRGDRGYDLWLMDSSGAVLQSFETEIDDCPIGFSDDRQWMLYYQAEPNLALSTEGIDNFLLNVENGESYPLDTEASIYNFIWSGSGNLLAYLDYEGNLGIYNVDIQEEIFVTETNEAIVNSRTAMRFRGRDLIYTIKYSRETLSVYYWDGESIQTEEYSNEMFVDMDEMEFSPNGRFLRILSWDSDVFVLDLETGELFIAGSGYSHWLLDEPATLFYLSDDGENISGAIYEVLQRPDVNEAVVGGDYPFEFSHDGNYLSYFVEDEFGGKSLWQMNRQSGESALVAQDAFMAEVEWLSDTSFVYLDPPPLGGLRELYFYDALVSSNRQVTNQPEVDKNLHCQVSIG